MSETAPDTIEVIAERIKADSQPDRRDDPFKVGVIFQGGAMRGVVATGANIALESMMGTSEPFDRADSTSAGAYSWAALAGRTSVETSSIYYEELTQGFVNRANLLRPGRHAVNLGRLIEAVSEGEKALNFDRLLSHPTEAIIYASQLPEVLPFEFRLGAKAVKAADEDRTIPSLACQTKADIQMALEATALMPVYAGPPLKLPDGRLLVDGGVATGRIPLDQAAKAGCTHLLVVATERNSLTSRLKPSRLEKVAAYTLARQFPELKDRFWTGFKIHQQTLARLRQAEAGELTEPKITVVRIDDELIPGRTTTDPELLFRAAQATETAVLRLFKPYGLKRDQAITARPPRALPKSNAFPLPA